VNNMSQVWSEINKVVNVLDMKSQSGTSGAAINCDIVNLENYKKLTYLIALGSDAAANAPTVTVYGGESATGATTAIAFRYRTQVTGNGGSTGTTGSDISSALTTGATTGFQMSTGDNNGVYIIEVDPPTVLAASTTGVSFDHVKLRLTNSTDSAAQIYGVIAVLSEPRYPQAILQTAID